MRMGRHYESHEWLEFLTEPEAEVTEEMERLREVIRFCVVSLWWERTRDDEQDEDELAYLFHMTHTEAGVGFWDRDDPALVAFGEYLEQPEVQADPRVVVASMASEELDVLISIAQNPEEE